ncbi:MAG: glycosyltransferase family 4 protein, partial [Candidatus Thermoplasmatota archaeon]
GHDKIYPPIGCAYRSYYLSKYLSAENEVTLIGHSGKITKFKHYRFSDSFEALEIPGLFSTAVGALGYFLTRKPILDLVIASSCKYSLRLLKEYVKHADKSQVLIFEGCWHYPLLKKIEERSRKLVVYDAHNVEYILKEQAYTGFWVELLPKIFELERALCNTSDIIFATCKEEKEMFIKLYKLDASKIYTVPHGITLPHLDREKKEERTALFIGGAYFANFEAAQFINNVLAEKLPEFKFKIVGRCCMAVKKSQKNVELCGVISEQEKDKLLKTSELAINPILYGAGINVKMLEYMAYGMPIVTTTLGARGIECDKRPFLVSELDNFAESIKLLSDDKELAEELSRNAKETILRKYEWSKVTEGVSELLIKKYREKLL